MLNRKIKILPFLGIGLLIFSISVIMLMLPEKEYLETTGTIVRFEEYYDAGSDDNEIHTFIDYKAGGRIFKDAEYGSYSSSMRIGDKVIVYYDPENPEYIQAQGYKLVPYITGSVSLTVILCSLYLLIRN